ncbi:VOC family protein [Pseudomonas cremoricolorata]|uniref:VOC domain-containing protein n=1 Tax=Pseudomonas cremoricolorata TaxID=157783 RepID=A0A089WUT4_9PSED|nr:VOC family protein [Pseudomonas cremoricolorata]AIR90974.1 hypothetical protein LK03_17635 [Pseudomonas cremoricolorata]
MKIVTISLFVNDQAKAHTFYHHVLGFEPSIDEPHGHYRRLTLSSPSDAHGIQLLLEPTTHPAILAYQAALRADGMPVAAFGVKDVKAEYLRLCASGVQFISSPSESDAVSTAIFDDTCGNLIELIQQR